MNVKQKPSFPARLAGWKYQYERAEEAEVLAADRLEMNEELSVASLKVLCISLDQNKLLKRCRNWFRANYSYVYEDKEVMQLWGEIDDELDKGLGDE